MSDLLDLAMQRLSEVVASLGVVDLASRAVPEVNLEARLLQLELEPLVVPADAVHWWTSGDVEDLAFLHDDYFVAHPPLTALAERRFIIGLEHPHVLLPIMKEEKRELAIELIVDGHPGGRIFEVDFHGGEIRLIGSNMAHLVDLLSDALEQSAGHTANHERLISRPTYSGLVDRRHAALGRVTLNPYDLAGWPAPWLQAAGLTSDGIALKDATHTVAEFDEMRRTSAATAVLHGSWQTLARANSGIRGTFGTLTDSTGSITVFVPDDAIRTGFRPNGACQIEVMSGTNPTAATSPAGTPSHDQTLERQPADLDDSVVAAAIRPIATGG